MITSQYVNIVHTQGERIAFDTKSLVYLDSFSIVIRLKALIYAT